VSAHPRESHGARTAWVRVWRLRTRQPERPRSDTGGDVWHIVSAPATPNHASRAHGAASTRPNGSSSEVVRLSSFFDRPGDTRCLAARLTPSTADKPCQRRHSLSPVEAWSVRIHQPYQGAGVPKDVAEAVKWHRLAAERGNADASVWRLQLLQLPHGILIAGFELQGLRVVHDCQVLLAGLHVGLAQAVVGIR